MLPVEKSIKVPARDHVAAIRNSVILTRKCVFVDAPRTALIVNEAKNETVTNHCYEILLRKRDGRTDVQTDGTDKGNPRCPPPLLWWGKKINGAILGIPN